MITYRTDMREVNWQKMKAILEADDFDNGRSPEQLRFSFERSYQAVVAYDGEKIVGTARVLSDGVCNAYVVDVWTLSHYRRQGIATAMMNSLFAGLEGQHVYLFTDDAAGFYRKLGFERQGIGLSKVIGEWLRGGPAE